MGKFAAILIAIYILYYAGNIIYDLFIKQDAVINDEESEEFILIDFRDKNRDEVQNIGVENVEDLNTPDSFNTRELPLSSDQDSEERQDLEHLREKFESEQDIDSFATENNGDNENPELENVHPHNTDKYIGSQNSGKTNSLINNTNRDRFRNLLNLAETNVQLILHQDGYKIYQSMM